eukprot:jgi/Psemu1/324764/estExt_fgenesh1_pg.C_1760003
MAATAPFAAIMLNGTALVVVLIGSRDEDHVLVVTFSPSRLIPYAYNGNRESMILPLRGWKALEIISEGDSPNNGNGGWEIPDKMDGVGALVVSGTQGGSDDGNDDGNDVLRLYVNHEDEDEATISEINLHKGRLKQAIGKTLASENGGTNGNNNYDFVQSTRVAYDRWSPDGGSSWKYIGADITDPKGAGGFCRFCSSQYIPPEAFGKGRGFTDAVYLTGEECWDNGGRLFALDVHDEFRDLYLVSGIAGETLRLYIGKKFASRDGTPDKTNFLARNGLAHGRWFYLGGDDLQWAEDPLWKTTTPGRFVTDIDDAWSESKFEDIDTNPLRPTQVVLAESNSGVYILDLNLVFDNASGKFLPARSTFSVRMIASNDNVGSSERNPDNVDWTKNNLIFVNKDNDTGGIWYMNPDGTNKAMIGETRHGGESTGILDVSELLDYPPASAMITTNQGYPSSITLLLNPSLNSLVVGSSGGETETPPPVATPIPVTLPPLPSPTTAPPTKPPVSTIVADNNYDSSQDCPEADAQGLFRVYQAEEAILYSAWIKTSADHFCGSGYVDFVDITAATHGDKDPGFSAVPISGGGNNGIGRLPVFDRKDGSGSGPNTSRWNKKRDRDWGDVAVSREGTRRAPNVVGISFVIDIAVAGTYKVSFRYANGGDLNSSRPGLFMVDGDFLERRDDYEFEFRATYGWSIWSVESKTVTFDTEGSHTLDLMWIETKNRPNLDWLSVEWMGN